MRADRKPLYKLYLSSHSEKRVLDCDMLRIFGTEDDVIDLTECFSSAFNKCEFQFKSSTISEKSKTQHFSFKINGVDLVIIVDSKI